MFHLHALAHLDAHQQFLQTRSGTQNVFLVGGCVRDILLWITKSPLDIDVTMRGTPEELYAKFDTKGLSHFITEKFGTMTFLQSVKKGGKKAECRYELTPLRTEGGYGDFRHPEEIQWSNDLLLDSQRRDFTINAMYYFSTTKQSKAALDFKQKGKALDDKMLIALLEREGYCYLTNLNVLILRSEQYIQQVFGNASFDETYFRYLVETQKEGYVYVDSRLETQDSRGKDKDARKKWEEESWKLKDERGNVKRFRVLIDATGGLRALGERKLETVGEADKRFGEDALRVIRGLRIVNVLNHQLFTKLFDFTNTTRESIRRNVALLAYVAKERIKDELTKVFIKGNPFWFIVLLDSSGILPLLFPALAATKFVEQPIRYHSFDVYTHTLLTLKALQEINADYVVRFAMLYHDVGKVAQYVAYEQAQGDKEAIRAIISGPLNHRNSSPELMKQDFRALGFSNKELDEIARYIAEHHTPWEILQSNPQHREKKVRKLFSENNYERVDNLFDINIADRKGQFNPLQCSSDLTDSYALKKILKKLNEEEGHFKKADLAVNGSVLMKELKLAPGPLLWELLHQGFERVLNDISTRNTQQALLVYLKSYLKNRKE